MSIYDSYYIFEWLDDEVITSILETSKTRKYDIWETIIKEWEESNWEAYIINSWSVNIFIDNNFVAKIEKWNIFWEYALIREEPRTATVVVNDTLECIVIDIDSLFKLLEQDNRLSKILITRITENIEKNLWVFKE